MLVIARQGGKRELIGRRRVQALRDFSPGDEVVVSFYLDVSAEKSPRQEYRVIARNLLREAKSGLDEFWTKEARRAVEADLDKIERFVNLGFQREGRTQGLAVFACEPRGLWEVFSLPGPAPDLAVTAAAPYLRPLWLQLFDHPRYGVALLHRAGGRFLVVSGGEAEEVLTVASDVPSRVRRSGWAGLKGRRIERHIGDHVWRHLKEMADRTLALCQEQECDYLVVGGNQELGSQFMEFLVSPWRERLLGFLPLPATARPALIVAEVGKLGEEAARRRGKEALDAVLSEVKAGGQVVTGLAGTLRALQEGAVTTLVVDRGFSASGFRCRPCGHLDLQTGLCPRCGRILEPVPDLVTEMVELALERGCAVERVDQVPRRDQLRGVGALLRFLPTPSGIQR